jgi:hypothetical protein
VNARARRALVLACLALLATEADAQAPAPAAVRTWEIDGIRLEPSQVERLADDMAGRTVRAVQTRVPDLALAPDQQTRMREVYRTVALDVFAEVVKEVARTDLSDADKEARVRALVLAGQKRSHGELAAVLDARQLALYSKWEDAQVAAFESRRLGERRRRR